MMNEKNFQKNVELWSTINPKKAIMLPYLQVKGKLPGNLGTPKEAKEWAKKLDLKKTQALFVYGVGLGHYYAAIKPWLKKHRSHRLIFLEDDMRIIWQLFQTQEGTDILKDPQVSLYFFQDLDDWKSIFDSLHWDFYEMKITVSALNKYAKDKRKSLEELHHRIVHDALVRETLICEYLQYGVQFFRNFYCNMLKLPKSQFGNALFGKFKKVPAIICGAGPSLGKQLPLLKKLMKNALIFGGGSAMNALNSADILPHFGGALDPNEMQAERIRNNTAHGVPYFYRNRLFYQVYSLLKGPRLYVTGGGGFEVSDWFESQLGIEGISIEEGPNVVTFLMEIAQKMGCDPIIFVGMDLAYTDMKSYAPGVIPNEKVNKSDILKEHAFDKVAFQKPDIHGKPVYTLWKWVAEAEYIGEFATKNPKTTFINATEGGIGFPGIPNRILKNIKFLKQSDYKKRVQKSLQSATLPKITPRKVRKLMKEFLESMQRSRHLLDSLITEADRLSQKIQQEKSAPKDLQTGFSALCESDLAEEVAYTFGLAIFNDVSLRLLNKKAQEIKRSKAPDWKIALKKLSLHKHRLSFLKDVASVNIELMNMALEGTASSY